jgi:hypothetical protein
MLYIGESKTVQVLTPQQPKTTQVSVPRQIYIPRPRPVATATPTHEDIAKRAYEIYTRKGRRQDQSEQNWLQAERELQNKGLETLLLKQFGYLFSAAKSR